MSVFYLKDEGERTKEKDRRVFVNQSVLSPEKRPENVC